MCHIFKLAGAEVNPIVFVVFFQKNKIRQIIAFAVVVGVWVHSFQFFKKYDSRFASRGGQVFLELAIVAGVRLSPTKVTLWGGFRGICGKIKRALLHCYMLHVTIRWFHMSRMLLAKRGYGDMGQWVAERRYIKTM